MHAQTRKIKNLMIKIRTADLINETAIKNIYRHALSI